jgi:hypothetical protein
MATRFGNFKELSQGKKPMTADEAYLMLKELGMLGNQFIPGAESLGMLLDGKSPKEAAMALQDWIPGNAAYQNWLNDKPQDWTRNAVDAAAVGIPLAKPAGKALKKGAEFVERIPKGGKEGFLRLKKPAGQNTLEDFIEASNEAGQKITPEIEKEIRNYVTDFENGKSSALLSLGRYDAMSPEAKQIVDGYMWQKTADVPKPKGFDDWTAKQRAEYIENHFIKPEGKSPLLAQKLLRTNKDENYGLGHQDYGSIFPDKISLDDYVKAVDDKEPELAAARKADELRRAKRKEKNAIKQAEKEAKWKAMREAEAKRAELNRLAKEAEQKRLAEEAEQKRLAEEAEAKLAEEKRLAEEAERRAQEEEFERQFREEEAYERNRYADSVGTALGRETVDRDIDNWLFDKLVESENKAKPEPITTMDVFTGESYGNTPTVGGNSIPPTGKTRPSYDHSREFNGGSFQKLAPINRSELKGNGDLGERIFDAQSRFYLPDTKPGEYISKMSTDRYLWQNFPKTPAVDPYHEAGIINDENVKLNRIIDRERSKGKTDAEIYREYKKDFDNYQGMLERYKARLNNPRSNFDYDGAHTSSIVATPSEEINVLRKLGMIDEIDPRMAGYMDDISDHYKGLTKRIFDYESKFPRSPKLTNEQFKLLKDMGVKPEDIDAFLADNPDFFMQ